MAGAEAAPKWGVSVGMIPKIAETLVYSVEASSGRLTWAFGLEAMMIWAKLSVRCCFRGGDRGTQCSVGADHGHNVRTQWPVIPAMPCPSRYGADATSGPIGHSVASSHRPPEIAGVIEVLMRHDALSGGSVEAGGDGLRMNQPQATRRMRPRARRRMRPRARRRSDSLPRHAARGLARYGERTPCRGLPWRA